MAVEIVEVIVLIMMCIAIISLGAAAIRYRDLLKYIPAGLCIWLVFIFTNLEAVPGLEELNLLEHVFIMLTMITFASALFYDYYSAFIKRGGI
ncbi:MAG: hypothetical protein GF311_24525 [Candidatus Lokiarchaeota archaeon]|nr:hypothetical protein [Candidatus Lokiarchaeota archaeon]